MFAPMCPGAPAVILGVGGATAVPGHEARGRQAMQALQATHQSTAQTTAGTRPTPGVFPRGGMVFCALCFAAYAAAIVVADIS